MYELGVPRELKELPSKVLGFDTKTNCRSDGLVTIGAWWHEIVTIE